MTNQQQTIHSHSDNFNEFLKDYKTEIVNQHEKGYYPFNVVVEAYQQGVKDGTATGKQELVKSIIENDIETFSLKVQQLYLFSKQLINYIQENEFSVLALHLKITPQNLRGIIVIPEQQNLNDSFINLSYNKLADFETTYSQLTKNNLDLSFIGNENLETDLFEQDGFNYTENYTNG